MDADRLVGRERELAVLQRCWRAALDGQPNLVVIVGEAGVGKTRLATELASEVGRAGATVAWSRAHEDAGTPTYWLWRQVLGGSDVALRVPHGPDGRDDLFDAITGAVRQLDDGHGALVVLDDVQWADTPSLVALRHVLAVLGRARVLFVATARVAGLGTPLLADLARDRSVARVELRPFDVVTVAELLAAVNGAPVEDEIASRVWSTTGGNPFFVREVAAAGVLSDGEVPATVLDAVAGRVARLRAPVQELLRTAAVVGDDFAVPVIASLLDRTANTCLDELDEARREGFVQPSDVPGNYRFGHALVRMAIEAGLPARARAELHEHAARVIETVYGDELRGHLAELAHHWAAAASAGDHRAAFEWSMRAAQVAAEDLAFEDAVSLYRLALDAGGATVAQGERADALTAMAVAAAGALDLGVASNVASDAMAAALAANDVDRVVAAALALECVGNRAWDRAIRERCRQALRLVPDADVARRARLLARVAHATSYDGDFEAAGAISADALALAEESGDIDAIVAASHARQLAVSGPDGLDERMALAQRMIQVGSDHDRPVDEMWGHQWMTDVLFERGDLASLATELGRLRASAARVGSVFARWHALLAEGALAQATARFDRALECSREAFALLAPKRHPAAFGAHMAGLGAVRHHLGYDAVGGGPDSARPPDDLAPNPSEVNAPIFMFLGPAYEFADAGRVDEARMLIGNAGAVERWDPPPYFYLSVYALAARVFGVLGDRESLAYCCTRLEPYRGHHVTTTSGTAHYAGPVELALGRGARELGHLDESERDLRVALERCRANGAIAIAAEAAIELAATLLARGDREEALALVGDAAPRAAALGMAPWVEYAAAISDAAATSADGDGVLSPREHEVAKLVAAGRTNREIADELFMSVRTAQNHVQHILVKLGFSSRSQIASWVTARER